MVDLGKDKQEAVIFYAQIPYMRRHVMIRMFHFLIADLGISFTSSDYTSTVMSERERERERERMKREEWLVCNRK